MRLRNGRKHDPTPSRHYLGVSSPQGRSHSTLITGTHPHKSLEFHLQKCAQHRNIGKPLEAVDPLIGLLLLLAEALLLLVEAVVLLAEALDFLAVSLAVPLMLLAEAVVLLAEALDFQAVSLVVPLMLLAEALNLLQKRGLQVSNLGLDAFVL
jgi:hypothetical protein